MQPGKPELSRTVSRRNDGIHLQQNRQLSKQMESRADSISKRGNAHRKD
jgi:hypothetical protein